MRNYTIDFIRVLAMMGVISDHYLQRTSSNILINTGLCMGGVSVAIFIVISAYLYGVKWRKQRCEGFDVVKFLKKRFLRIFIPLWLMLFVAVLLEWYVTHDVSGDVVLFNFLGLGWAKPLGGQGHLWYITMTLIVYLLVLVISRGRLDKIPMWGYLLGFMGLSVFIIAFPATFSSFSRAIIPFTIFYSTVMFACGDKVMSIFKRYQLLCIFITIAMIALSYECYLFGWHFSHKAIASLSSALSGVLIFLCSMTLIDMRNKHKLISWFSARSYEIYLMHLSMILFAKLLVGENWIHIPLGLVLIVAGGSVLHYLSGFIYKIIKL